MSLYKRGETWWIYIVHGGKRVRRSTGTSDREAAEEIHDRLKAELWDRQHRPASHTFAEAIALWLDTGEKGLPDRYRLRNLGLADLPLSAIDESRLAETLDAYTGSTRNRVINLITAVLNCAVKRGWIERVPHMARIKVRDNRVRWLTADEWHRLQAELPCHLRNMARFSVYTGLRENNVIGLEWSQVDMQRRVAWVHADQTKAGKPIGIPLSDEALRVLEAQDGQHARWVFPYAGHPVTKCSTKAWWKALERAELGEYEGKGKDRKFIPNFRWHDLRHTWASWHVMNGTPLEVLQKLGGWKTLQMVLRYAHLAPEHLASFANNAMLQATPQAKRTQVRHL